MGALNSSCEQPHGDAAPLSSGSAVQTTTAAAAAADTPMLCNVR